MLPGRVAFLLSASVLCCTAWTTAQAQSSIHEPTLVTPVTPPAAAETPASPTGVSPLTVQAPPPPATIEKQARSFVETYAAAANPQVDQIARWYDAICVQVVGPIGIDQAIQVAQRIQAVARSLNVRVQPPNCKPNIQIDFSDHPQDTLDMVAEKEEQVLGYHSRGQLKSLKTVTRPIQAWYMTASRGAADIAGAMQGINASAGGGPGGLPPLAQFSAIPGVQTANEVVDAPENGTPAGCADKPHFTSCMTGVFKNVLIVADNRMVSGKNAGAVADYLAMLALSQPRSLDGCNALPSIVDLLAKAACSGRDAPGGLTPADAAYLTALYSADLEAKKAGETSDISNRMARILIKASTGGR
jgi:hypothetical protein